MKRLLVILLTAAALTGCGSSAAGSEPAVSAVLALEDGGENAGRATDAAGLDETLSAAESLQEIEATEPEEETAFPGSYTVPEGWVTAESHSTAKKIFFVQEGHENDMQPDNISIEVGKNRYKAEEHELFREAILKQLLMQTKGLSAELNGSGTSTEQGYILYVFTVKGSGATTVQYYIVDDYRYCLIHLTNFSGEEDACEAAQALADSFVWADADK